MLSVNQWHVTNFKVHSILRDKKVWKKHGLELMKSGVLFSPMNEGTLFCSQLWPYFIVQCLAPVRVRLVAQSCLTLCNPMDCSPPGSSVHGDSPGKNTGVGCHALLQGIFPIQGSKPGLPHCRQIFYHLSHQGSPYIHIYILILFRFFFPHIGYHIILSRVPCAIQ